MAKTSAMRALLLLAMAVAGPGAAPTPLVTLAVPDRVNAAPWVAAEGAFVAAVWGATAGGKTDVFLAVSRDGGASFGAPVRVNAADGEARLGGELPPRVVLVPRRGKAPEIVVLWTSRGEMTQIRTARSQDGGGTFAAPVTLQAPGAPGDRGWPALAADARGAIHAVWLDHRGLVAPRAAGTTAGHQHHKSEHDGVVMAQKSSLFYATAGRRGEERELTGGVCYCCKTALAASPDGTLFAAWRHVYPGNLRDIAMAVSKDGGRSFAAPARVSADDWAINGCPDDGPALAVDRSGTAHIVWPTVIGQKDPEGALFYASTRDGRAFTPRVRIPTLGSPKPAHPQIALGADGRIAVAWDETVDGRRVAAVREIRPAGGQGTFGEIVLLSEGAPAVYPVLAPTSDGFVAVWTSSADGRSVVQGRGVRLPLRGLAMRPASD